MVMGRSVVVGCDGDGQIGGGGFWCANSVVGGAACAWALMDGSAVGGLAAAVGGFVFIFLFFFFSIKDRQWFCFGCEVILGFYVVLCCDGFGVRRWWGRIWGVDGCWQRGWCFAWAVVFCLGCGVLLGLWFFFFFVYCWCGGQLSPVFKLYWRRTGPISSPIRTNGVRRGQAQYPVWGQTNIRGQPTKEGIKLPSEERWSVLVRNCAVSEDDSHLGTFVRGIWWTY